MNEQLPGLVDVMATVTKLAARLQEAAYYQGVGAGDVNESWQQGRERSERVEAASENLSICVESYLRAYATAALRASQEAWQESEVRWVEWNGEEFQAAQVDGLEAGTHVQIRRSPCRHMENKRDALYLGDHDEAAPASDGK